MKRVGIVGERSYLGGKFRQLSNHITSNFRGDPQSFDDVLFCIGGFGNGFGQEKMSSLLVSNIYEPIKFLEDYSNKNIVFNFLSTYFVYGNSKRPYQEDAIVEPVSFYGQSKAFTEKNIISLCIKKGIPYRIFRISNVLGSDDRNITEFRNTIQLLIERILRHQKVELFQAEKFIRDFILVEDFVRVCDLILAEGMKSTNKIYNIGNGIPIFVIDLLARVKKLSNSQADILASSQPFLGEIASAYVDTTRISRLGYTPVSILDDIRLESFLNAIRR